MNGKSDLAGQTRRQAVVNADTALPAAYRTKDAIDIYLQTLGAEVNS